MNTQAAAEVRKPTNDQLRATLEASMDRYHRLGGNTQGGIDAYMEALRARNDLVDRGVMCDRCEGDVVGGRCVSCDAKVS